MPKQNKQLIWNNFSRCSLQSSVITSSGSCELVLTRSASGETRTSIVRHPLKHEAQPR
uniref:Uncharacterized protein n=1 Tax=Arundo donax TaxID=35708 RepID=A0A0A9FP88_ARUDO